jgi:hypothetical protein
MAVGEVADFYIGVSVVKLYDYPDYWDDMDEDEREDWGPVDTYKTLNIRQIKKTIIAKGY